MSVRKIAKEGLSTFLEDYVVLPPIQLGFRHEHNTMQPLLRLKINVKTSFPNSKSTDMISLDTIVTFDFVWHNGLLYKMTLFKHYLVHFKIIPSYVTNR